MLLRLHGQTNSCARTLIDSVPTEVVFEVLKRAAEQAGYSSGGASDYRALAQHKDRLAEWSKAGFRRQSVRA